MIVWGPGYEGSPAYGVAAGKALGHPQQSCKGGRSIYHFVDRRIWNARALPVYFTSQIICTGRGSSRHSLWTLPLRVERQVPGMNRRARTTPTKE